MKMIRAMGILAAFGAAACGGPATSRSSSVDAQPAAVSYQSTGQSMATVVAQYRAATASMPDVAACQAAEASYESGMSAAIDHMNSLSGTMDHYMMGAMGGTAADMGCVAAAMSAEYAHHRAAACGSGAAADQAEAAHHAATMTSWVDHQRVRYEQMGEAMGITPATGDTTWTCVHHEDGTFTIDGQPWTPQQDPGAPPPATPHEPWPAPCGGASCPCDGGGHGSMM